MQGSNDRIFKISYYSLATQHLLAAGFLSERSPWGVRFQVSPKSSESLVKASCAARPLARLSGLENPELISDTIFEPQTSEIKFFRC